MSNSLPTPYQEFIHKSRYARWKEDHQRRENWGETVARYFDYMQEHLKNNHAYTLTSTLRNELENAVLGLEVMPSMRAMMTSGDALDRDNVCGYNCSYIPVDSPRSFDECMYILMCGTGVGFSVSVRTWTSYPPFQTTSTIQTQLSKSVTASPDGQRRTVS